MSNSTLATYRRISPWKNSPRNHSIDTITVHCYVGQVTAKNGVDFFATTDKEASANYVIGTAGDIGVSVDEADRSWCSSSSENDNRAVTIECACDATAPYAINSKVYASLVNLVTDICKRNGIKKLVWSTNKNDRVNHKNGCNMTVHRDYAAKACPGDYIYERLGQIASEVNARLAGQGDKPGTGGSTGSQDFDAYTVQVAVSDLNIRSGPGTNNDSKGFIAPGVYTIVEEASGKGASKWGRLKSGRGWISLDYVKRIGSTGGSSSQGFKPYTVDVNVTELRIRSGPGTDTASKGFIAPGVYTIVEEASGKGASKWGRLKSGQGWISLDYATKC